MNKLTNSEKHIKVRIAQATNKDSHHHQKEKIEHLNIVKEHIYGDILEVFGGQGNLTSYYRTLGNVTSMTKQTHGDSFHSIYKLRAERKSYDVIDIDGYGYPSKFFPVVFEMIKDEGLLIFTFPVIGVQCVNGIVEQNFVNFWGTTRPTIGDIVGKITDYSLREWKLATLLSVRKIKPIWRFAFLIKREKATLFCNVRNR